MAFDGIALGIPVGFFVGAAVGTGTNGVGLGEMDGLAETVTVGAIDATSDGIAVAFAVGAALGLADIEGAVVFTAIGALVGERDGALVIVKPMQYLRLKFRSNIRLRLGFYRINSHKK